MHRRPTLALSALLLTLACIDHGVAQDPDLKEPIVSPRTGPVLPDDEALVRPPPGGRSDWVTVRTHGCLGTCPLYEVTLNAEGTVKWKGDRFVETVGLATEHVDPDDAAALFEKLRSGGLRRLPRSLNCKQEVSDAPWTIVTISLDGETTRIPDYHGCFGDPRLPLLRRFERRFAKLVDTRRWVGEFRDCIDFGPKPGSGWTEWDVLLAMPDIRKRDPSVTLRIHAHASKREPPGSSLVRAKAFLADYVYLAGGDPEHVEILDHAAALAELPPDSKFIGAEEQLQFDVVSQDCLSRHRRRRD